MPSFLSKIKALASPSSKRKSKSANDLNSFNSQGYVFKEKDLSKLQLAAWKGDMEKVAEYCKPGKLDAADKEGRTPLHLAVAANHRNAVQYLLDQGAKLDVFDKELRTPLTIAAINGSVEILSILLASNKNKARVLVNKNDNKGLNVLHYAVRNEKASLILRILSNIDSLEINHEDKDKNTALHIATITENLECVKLLIERGAEIDAQNCDGRTPLMLAAIKSLDNIMRLLVEYSCDQNIRDRENKRAEDYSKGKPECMDVLRGVVRQSKSFSVPEKKVQNPQTMRSPSLGHEASSSDTTHKFQNLFGSGGASNMLGPEDNDDNEFENEEDEYEEDDDEGLDTSQILDQNNNQHLYVNRGAEKVNSWNDSDLSFQDNPILLNNAERNQQFGGSNFDSLFQTFKADNQQQVNQKSIQNQNKPTKSILTKKQDEFSDDSSWNDSTAVDDKNIFKKNQENFAFVSLGDLKNDNADQSKNECTWFIYVYTSNIKNAGTDAKVSIQIIGSKGMSNKTELDKEENISNKNLFETGSCDKFVKVFSDFGKPIKIKIGHDNSGHFAGWHLDKVILQRASTQDKFTFTAKRWLAKDEGDKKIEIDINCDEPLKDDKKSLNSWNSSGDEDSSISLKKPTHQISRPLNQINEELNETTGSKKSSNSNGDKNENKKNIVRDTIVNSNNKMPRETSWANKQQQQKPNSEPPEISDIDDDSNDINDFLNKGPNERGVDVPYDFKQPISNTFVNVVIGSKKPSNEKLVQKKEDLVDLEDFSDWGDSSSANPGKNSAKYVIPNALVKPVVETKPHHGLGGNGRDTPIYENEEFNDHNNTEKFTVYSPNKDAAKQLTPLKNPIKKNSSIDDKSDDTEYENDSDRDSPLKKSNNNPISNVLINKNIKQNESFYEDIGSDIDDIENEIQNIINKKPPTPATTTQPSYGDLVIKVVMNPQQQINETKWTNFNEKKQNSPKINSKIETSSNAEENYVPNSTIGKLISNFAPKNANLLKKDDIDQISDLESTSEMRTSKIEELITSLQPNKTTWGQKNKIDENKLSQTSSENNSPAKQQDNNSNSALASLISQTVLLPKGNSTNTSKPSTADSSPVKQQISTQQDNNSNSALASLISQTVLLPKGNSTNTSKPSTADSSPVKQQTTTQQDNNSNSALASLISQTVLLPKDNSTPKSKPSTADSSPAKQQSSNQQDNNSNSALASLISQTVLLPKGNSTNTSKPSTADSSPVKQQTSNRQDNKYSALGALVNQHMSLPKESVDSPTLASAESSLVKQQQLQENKYSALVNFVNQNMSLPKEKVDSSKPPMPDLSPSKQQYTVLNSIVGNTIKLQNNNNNNTGQNFPIESPQQQFSSFDFINQGLRSNSTGNFKEESATSGVNQLISQILTKKVDDDEDERKAEYLRKKRAEQEKELELAKRKQKDHAGSLSSDFGDDEDENENDVDDYDVDDNGIVVEPPIAFSKHSGNISSSLGTFSPSVGNEINFDRNSHVNDKKGNLIDIIDFSTSESDFLRNERLSRETDKFKNQFDLMSNSNSNLVQQQLRVKQTEVAQLKQQLDEALKQKKLLESELKASNDKKKDLEAVLASTEHVLAEKEKIHLDIGSKNNETDVIIRKNNLMIKDLQNELNNFKNEKSNLESRLKILQSNNKNGESALIQSLNEQNEKYSIEIKALKNQIEELNTDRNKLSETKEELSFLLDKSDNRISEQNTVLEKIINQSEFEKAVIKTENIKLKNDLNELNDLKKKLTDEIHQIKVELKDAKAEIEKLTKEKQELEKNVDREIRDKENVKKKSDSDTSNYKEQQLQLIEKLGFTEAKLVSAEKEYKYCKNALQEKQAQLDELKGTLTKMNSELNVQEGLLNKEREEKIRLSAKNESIEERLRLIQEENNNLKRQHSDYVETSKYEKIHTISLKEMEKKKIDSEKEVSLLKQDLDLLNQKLHNAELELKNEKHVHVNQTSRPYETVHEHEKTKQSSPLKNENKDAYMEESRKIKMELDQLRSEFHLLLSKYEVSENDQQYPTRDYEIRPQDFVYNRLKSNTNRIDVPGLITSNLSSRNLQASKNYHPIDLKNDNFEYYNPNNHPQFDPSRATIIIPNGEILVPKPDISPTKISSHSNKGPCDRCYSETQNYIEMVRNEIARTVEFQAAKEQPLSNLTYKSAINSHTTPKNYISNTSKLDNYESLRNSILENARYSTTNFDLVNSLRSKYFV